ncbi:hypothetical protein EOPP23_03225 [Endozoicomonas sp. OPT23]|uniref:TetR family transcriptional regulator n=1 Tax=Endozoicomonas sp. OPT23 TaxID=2072845 RepID=UPI0018918777|nr:TetR family transcriptional regulator [Endozoicomonas sp. OPT23]MRI32010.1 hypothetical protein [Endozoicomonas sp. OPT23]
MARKTKEEAEETRRFLMKTALKLFSEQGIQNTTLAVVAKEAGVTRGAIYWHFKDKADMLLALWESIFSPLELAYEKHMDGFTGDPLDILEEIAASFFQLACSSPDILQMLKITRQSWSDPILSEHCRKMCSDEVKSIQVIMEKAENAGCLREDLSAKAAAFSFYGYLEGVINSWLSTGGGDWLLTEAEGMARVMIQGLRKSNS